MRGTTTAPEICAGLYNWQVLGVIFVLHAPIVHCVSWYSSQRPRRKTVILIEVPQAHTAGLSGFSTCWSANSLQIFRAPSPAPAPSTGWLSI